MEVDVMKIAVITGASSGLGREFAKQINQHFVTLDEVWLIARREERLNELKESLHGVHVRTIPIDLCDRDAVGTYEEMLQKFHPQIRVLVNAAGYGKMGYVEQISEEDLAGEIRLNCESLTRMTKISLPYMAKRSNIINIASSAAFMPQPKLRSLCCKQVLCTLVFESSASGIEEAWYRCDRCLSGTGKHRVF